MCEVVPRAPMSSCKPWPTCTLSNPAAFTVNGSVQTSGQTDLVSLEGAECVSLSACV